jgi:hypothetical protein
MSQSNAVTRDLIRAHFEPVSIESMSITERQFPSRVRVDLQLALERLLEGAGKVHYFCGVHKLAQFDGIDLSSLMVHNPNDPAVAVPPQYEEVDVGDDRPVRCLKNGLWLLDADGSRLAVFLEHFMRLGRVPLLRVQMAIVNHPAGSELGQGLIQQLEAAALQAPTYRGKILSLEVPDRYTGQVGALLVHRLASVDRDQVILPARTLELLERNVVRFVELRDRLGSLGLATKKGLLFYGPPGTGKSHTIQYLAGALRGHTTLLITAEQVVLLSEYMALARLLQPSLVVFEDVDLIGRERTEMRGPCEESLLNKLLNEMDGLAGWTRRSSFRCPMKRAAPDWYGSTPAGCRSQSRSWWRPSGARRASAPRLSRNSCGGRPSSTWNTVATER